MRELAPMPVERVPTEHGSRIEPPMNERWAEEDQLRWHAAVVTVDTGRRITLNVQREKTWRGPALYGYSTSGSAGGLYTRGHMWTFLNGFWAASEKTPAWWP